MIPIKATGDLTTYRHYIRKVKKDIEEVIEQGFIGSRGQFSWQDVKATYQKLDEDQKKKYLKNINSNGYKSFERCEKYCSGKAKIRAPKKMLSAKEIEFLGAIKDRLDEIAEADVDKLKVIIKDFQNREPLYNGGAIDKDSEIYKAVYKIFVTDNYEKPDFKETVWKVTNLKVCPYCNHTYIPLVYINGEPEGKYGKDSPDKSVKGQLDHFFPKEKYPYLAVSLYNLVPSCGCCNGPLCKASKDPYEERYAIVSPFSITDHRGLRFKLRDFDGEIFNLAKYSDEIEIEVDVSDDPRMAFNNEIFHLKEIYGVHKDIARDILIKYNLNFNERYLDSWAKFLGDPLLNLSRREIAMLYWGVPVDDELLGERPLAKFTVDMIEYIDALVNP